MRKWVLAAAVVAMIFPAFAGVYDHPDGTDPLGARAVCEVGKAERVGDDPDPVLWIGFGTWGCARQTNNYNDCMDCARRLHDAGATDDDQYAQQKTGCFIVHVQMVSAR